MPAKISVKKVSALLTTLSLLLSLLSTQINAQSPDPSASPSPSVSPSPSPTPSPSTSPSPSPSPSVSPSPAVGASDQKEQVLGESTSVLGETGNERDYIMIGFITLIGLASLIFGIKLVRGQTEE